MPVQKHNNEAGKSRGGWTPAKAALTGILQAWSDGDRGALAKLTPLVYQELHRLARGYMARERPGHLLQASELINEAYIRLIDWRNVRWKNRAHFFGVAASLMRRILVDLARAECAVKRGGRPQKVQWEETASVSREGSDSIVAVHEAMDRLAAIDARKAKVVELRFFGGLTTEEAAAVTGVSMSCVESDWRFAKAWLKRELGHGKRHSS